MYNELGLDTEWKSQWVGVDKVGKKMKKMAFDYPKSLGTGENIKLNVDCVKKPLMY